MNDPRQDDIARKIAGFLDRGAADLRPGLAYRLQSARQQALARLEPQAVAGRAGGLATAGGGTSVAFGGHGHGRPWYAQARTWIGVAIIAAGAIGIQQWQSWRQVQELEDIDAQILTSDLPIDAYLDRGFQNWLKSSDGD